MTTIGILGDVSVGKTSILRNFIRYVQKDKISKIEGGKSCTILLADFSGEATIEKELGITDKETKTIHPNRVNFKENKTGFNHTIFAPGGDRERAVVKMGIITISRIVKQVIAVFSFDQPLKDQFEFYDSVRHFPKDVFVCLNKYDLLKQENLKDLIEQIKIEEWKKKIIMYFKKRGIIVREFFYTCSEENEEFLEFNDNAARMILLIATDNIETASMVKNLRAETEISN